MKKLLSSYWKFACKPASIAIAIPISIVLVRFAWAYIPTVDAQKLRVEREIQQVVKDDPRPGIPTGIDATSLRKTTIVLYVAKCNCYHDNLVTLESGITEKADIKVMMMEDEGSLKLKNMFAKHSKFLAYDKGRKVGNLLNIRFVPRVFVVDSHGKLLWLFDKYQESWQELVRRAKEFLEGKK